MKASYTGVGIVIVTLLNAVLPMVGIQVPEGSVQQVVTEVFNVIGFIVMIYGQWRRPEVTGFIGKK